ncbi:MAG: hypothetical protein H6686_02720 [Fibrobacteria bacterium]|nr:hypothetical protein [Fibrobacteria bacterium]
MAKNRNAYNKHSEVISCPILIDPIIDTPTHYVLAVNDPRNAPIKSELGPLFYSEYLARKPGALIKAAALWHYLNLQKTTPPTECVKLIGWRGKGAPKWISPAAAKSKEKRDKWFKEIDESLHGIQSLKEWLFAMTSSSISSVDYFAHGSVGGLSMEGINGEVDMIGTVPSLLSQLVDKALGSCACGKFSNNSEIRLFSCQAGLEQAKSDTDLTLSAAAGLAQTFKIRAFGSPYKITLRPDLENSAVPIAAFVSENSEKQFTKNEDRINRDYNQRKPIFTTSEKIPKTESSEESIKTTEFYRAEWRMFLPFNVPESAAFFWEGSTPMSSDNTIKGEHEMGLVVNNKDKIEERIPLPAHFQPQPTSNSFR